MKISQSFLKTYHFLLGITFFITIASIYPAWTLIRDGIKVQTSILSLLPGQSQTKDILKIISEKHGSEILWLVSLPVEQSSLFEKFKQDLLNHKFTAKIDGSSSGKDIQDLQNAYTDLQFQFLPKEFRNALTKHDSIRPWLEAQLASPMSSFYALDQDPLLLRSAKLSELMQSTGRLQTCSNGWLCVPTDSLNHYFIRLELKGGAFDSDIQDSLEFFRNQWIQRITKVHGQVRATGLPFFAREGRVQAQNELTLNAWLSGGITLFLLLIVFRRPSLIAISSIILAISVGCAFLWTIFICGEIHILALVFGSTLVGISDDYFMHYLVHRTEKSFENNHFFKIQWVAFLTSFVAFSALAMVHLKVLQEIAIFCNIGIFTSFLLVWVLFPLTPDKFHRMAPWWERFSLWSLGAVIRVGKKPKLYMILLLIIVIPGLCLLKSDDRMIQLQPPSKEQLKQDLEMRQILALPDLSRFILINANSLESALIEEERITPLLSQEVSKGNLETWNALSLYLSSCHKQYEDYQLIHQWWNQSGLTDLKSIGYQAAIINQVDAKMHEAFHCFDQKTISNKPYFRFLMNAGQVLHSDSNSWTLLVMTRAAKKPLSQMNSSESQWVDQQEILAKQMQEMRQLATWLTLGAYLLILIFFCYRYGLVISFRIMLPIVISTLGVLAVLGYCNIPMNFFTLMALILVLGIGMDYSIFMAHCDTEDEHLPLHWFATLVSASTTIGAFGTLILSKTPALHMFGVAILVGLGFSLMTAPLARPSLAKELKNK